MSVYANKIKELRKKHRWSQTDLANKAQISQQAVSLIESDKISPSASVLIMIANAFRVPVGALFEEKSPAAQGDGERVQELLNLLGSLNPAQTQRVEDFVAGLLASQEDAPDFHGKDS